MDRLANRRINLEEYASRRTKLASRPRAVFVELTQNCNLRCWMCRPDALPQDERMMSEHTFRLVTEELFPFAEIIDLRGWGESLLYPGFKQAVEVASRSGAKVKLYTNLNVDDPTLYQSLVEHCVLTTVSFDAATRDRFNRLRRGSDFDLIIRNLGFITREFSKRGRPDLVELSVTVQGDNLCELDEIVKLAGRFGIPRVRLFPVICPKESHAHLDHHSGHLREILDQLAITGQERGVAVQLGVALIDSIAIPAAVLSDSCIHPWTHCYIAWDGGVGFCDHLIGNQRYILGNISDGLMTAWNSADFVRLRSEHVARAISDKHDACRWCYGRRYTDTEHELMPEAESRLVCSSMATTLHGTGVKAADCDFVSGTDTPLPILKNGAIV
jgi:radical SAM protein with 4Fe4S-binding SPASM domain